MLSKVPSSEQNFIHRLGKIQNSASYTAPEMMIDRWYELSVALEYEFGESPKEDWQWEVANILMDRALDCRENVAAGSEI